MDLVQIPNWGTSLAKQLHITKAVGELKIDMKKSRDPNRLLHTVNNTYNAMTVPRIPVFNLQRYESRGHFLKVLFKSIQASVIILVSKFITYTMYF